MGGEAAGGKGGRVIIIVQQHIRQFSVKEEGGREWII